MFSIDRPRREKKPTIVPKITTLVDVGRVSSPILRFYGMIQLIRISMSFQGIKVGSGAVHIHGTKILIWLSW